MWNPKKKVQDLKVRTTQKIDELKSDFEARISETERKIKIVGLIAGAAVFIIIVELAIIIVLL